VSPKRIERRPSADRDIDSAVEFYLREAGQSQALGFSAALEQALDHIARHPAAGSPRYGYELGLPGLRSWPLQRFPFLIFYADRDDHIEVLRILHAERDIAAHLR
jgi:toxin ParE1/3/4